MDHPVKDVSGIIHKLTEGSPVEQKHALETYFVPTASFTHPLCRVPSFDNVSVPVFGIINSRWVLWMIYRWYKILSPEIKLEVTSTVYDQKAQLLYASIHQVFSLWFVPFYKSNVHLVTVLHFEHDTETNKYHITHQEDLYQFNEWVKFFLPGGATAIYLFQLFATSMCVVGSILLNWVTVAEEVYAERVQRKPKKLQ